MKIWFNKYGFHLLFLGFGLVILLLGSIYPQLDGANMDQNGELELSTKEITNSRGREELQRYLGYEKLFYRYLTVPFDATISNNQLGRFLDIGFLLLCLLPIILLIKYKRDLITIILISIASIFYLSICLHNSQIIDYHNKKTVDPHTPSQVYFSENQFLDDPGTYFLVLSKKLLSPIYSVTDSVINKISKDKDHITYPFICLILIYLSFWIIRNKNDELTLDRLLALCFINYGFFWLTLSAGVVWYGFILLIFGYLVIGSSIRRKINSTIKFEKAFGYLSGTLCIIWIMISVFSRISNIPPMMTGSDLAKNMLNKSMSDYAVGKTNSRDGVLNSMHPGLAEIIQYINQDPSSKIWKIGTSFNSMFKQNHSRILTDDLLRTFSVLNQKYPDPITLVEVLKASDIKYLVLDLNLISIDHTPEKTLTEKYKLLIQFIQNNDNLNLLNTDRIISLDGSKTSIANKVFGEIIIPGSYAIYEIL